MTSVSPCCTRSTTQVSRWSCSSSRETDLSALCAAARAESPLIMDGTWGTCAWEIAADGKLTIHAGLGAALSGPGSAPWHACRESVRKAVVEGVQRLYGAAVEATDLRGAAALVTAALCAEGSTSIGGVRYLERGYEDFDLVLSSLGADIKKV